MAANIDQLVHLQPDCTDYISDMVTPCKIGLLGCLILGLTLRLNLTVKDHLVEVKNTLHCHTSSRTHCSYACTCEDVCLCYFDVAS